MQSWFRPHPYGVYPRGNAPNREDIMNRFGSLSLLVTATTADDKEHTELPYLELLQHLMGFLEVPELCVLSRTCTGWYVMVHCTDAFKNAYTILCPQRLRFRGSWKETAVRGYLADKRHPAAAPVVKKQRTETSSSELASVEHTAVRVGRPYFCDHLFQAWMCTLLPPYYHLTPCNDKASHSSQQQNQQQQQQQQQYTSQFRAVDRCHNISADEFRERYEKPNLPVVLTGIASEWPFYKVLKGEFSNLAKEKSALVRGPECEDKLLRCEYTGMSLDDYVTYATQQVDERPIYMFDAEFGSVLDAERLYTVPPHFARDDYFAAMGDARPKYRWIIAGPKRGGSSFHVDPNYTNAWNANLTGRKRWLLFPPGCTPPGVVPNDDMSEVATPLSLTEWLLNNYDSAVQEYRRVGYECVCEPGDIMFVPCGWWHSVINLEDSVAITQNYVSLCNVKQVIQFLRTMKGSISGINEDAEGITEDAIARRRQNFAQEFVTALRSAQPAVVAAVEKELAEEAEEREKKRIHKVALLEPESEGFTFAF